MNCIIKYNRMVICTFLYIYSYTTQLKLFQKIMLRDMHKRHYDSKTHSVDVGVILTLTQIKKYMMIRHF